MLEIPIEELCAPEIQDLIAYRFARAMNDLEHVRNPEKRKHVMGRLCKAMFVLGRWSLLVLLFTSFFHVIIWTDCLDGKRDVNLWTDKTREAHREM